MSSDRKRSKDLVMVYGPTQPSTASPVCPTGESLNWVRRTAFVVTNSFYDGDGYGDGYTGRRGDGSIRSDLSGFEYGLLCTDPEDLRCLIIEASLKSSDG